MAATFPDEMNSEADALKMGIGAADIGGQMVKSEPSKASVEHWLSVTMLNQQVPSSI